MRMGCATSVTRKDSATLRMFQDEFTPPIHPRTRSGGMARGAVDPLTLGAMLKDRVHSGCQLAVSSGRAGRRSGTGARRSRPPVWRSVRVFGCWSYSGGPTASTSRCWRSPREPSRGRVSTTRANATAVTSWLGRRDAVPTRACNRRTALAEGRALPGGLVETPKWRSANPEAEMWQPGGGLLALVYRCGERSVIGWRD
jgi:hypothetical protein